jgi:hypothetical protein
MPPCTHVCEDYPDGDCLAACLQSFLIDNGKSAPSQKEMINRAKADGLCGEKGNFVLHQHVGKFCALFGIDIEKIPERKIPKNLANGEGILLGCWNYDNANEHHSVRFCQYVSAEKFRVMDPTPLPGQDKFPEMETKQIDDWSCEIFKICLKPEMGPRN